MHWLKNEFKTKIKPAQGRAGALGWHYKDENFWKCSSTHDTKINYNLLIAHYKSNCYFQSTF